MAKTKEKYFKIKQEIKEFEERENHLKKIQSYKPYTQEDIIKKKIDWVLIFGTDTYMRIVSVTPTKIIIIYVYDGGYASYSYDEALKDLLNIDKTPFGIKKQ